MPPNPPAAEAKPSGSRSGPDAADIGAEWSVSDHSEDETFRLSASSLGSDAPMFSAQGYDKHIAKEAAKPKHLIDELSQPTFNDTLQYTGPPSSSLRPSNKSRFRQPLQKTRLDQSSAPSAPRQESIATPAAPGDEANSLLLPHAISASDPSEAHPAGGGWGTTSVRFDPQLPPDQLGEEKAQASAASALKASARDPSLMSVMVKNPLRKGLEWAGDSSSEPAREHHASGNSAGSGGSASQQLDASPSLMSVLVRRPLRGGIALAEQLQNTVAPAAERHPRDTSEGSVLQRAGGDARETDPAGSVHGAKSSANENLCGLAAPSAVAGHWKGGTSGAAGGGRGQADAGQAGGASGEKARHGGGNHGSNDAAASEQGRGEGDGGGGARAVAARGGGSLLSVVVKEPLRRSGWVEREAGRAAEGEGALPKGKGGQVHLREPSLLSVVVKRPLREFVWGKEEQGDTGRQEAAAAGEGVENAKAFAAAAAAGGGGGDACTSREDVRGKEEGHAEDDGVLQSGSHWSFGLPKEAPADEVSLEEEEGVFNPCDNHCENDLKRHELLPVGRGGRGGLT